MPFGKKNAPKAVFGFRSFQRLLIFPDCNPSRSRAEQLSTVHQSFVALSHQRILQFRSFISKYNRFYATGCKGLALSSEESLIEERLKNKLQIKRNKLLDKRKHSMEKRVVKPNQDVSQTQSQKEKCDLALDRVICEGELNQVSILIDDEDLELRELRTGPHQLMCSDHPAAVGMLGCSLCKGVRWNMFILV